MTSPFQTFLGLAAGRGEVGLVEYLLSFRAIDVNKGVRLLNREGGQLLLMSLERGKLQRIRERDEFMMLDTSECSQKREKQRNRREDPGDVD